MDFMVTSLEINSVNDCPALWPGVHRAGYPSVKEGGISVFSRPVSCVPAFIKWRTANKGTARIIKIAKDSCQ